MTGSYSKKIYALEDCPEKVTVRVLPEKLQVYPRFRDLVTLELGSDVCFVTTSLWEAFLLAMDQVPPPHDKLEMKFLRQNVQINIGCNILYQPKKARRTPGTVPRLPKIEMKKNLFLPLVLDEWKTLSEKQKEMLREQLRKEGIIPAAKPKRKRRKKPRKKATHTKVSTGIRKSKRKNFRKHMENSMTMYDRFIKKGYKRLRRLFRRKK